MNLSPEALIARWINWRMDRRIKKAIASGEMPDIELRKFVTSGKDMEILMAHPGVATMAEQAGKFLKAHNAENYVQFDLMPRLESDLRPIRVTVQWAGGLSPAVKNAQQAKVIEQQRAELARLRPLADAWTLSQDWTRGVARDEAAYKKLLAAKDAAMDAYLAQKANEA